MANALYQKWKEQLLQFTANNDLSAGTVKCALVDTSVDTSVYTTHQTSETVQNQDGAIVDLSTTTTRTFEFRKPSGTVVSKIALLLQTARMVNYTTLLSRVI